MDKYLTLVKLLIKRTRTSSAAWEPTPKDGTYSLSMPNFSIRISEVASGDSDVEDYLFEIVNSTGVVIDSFKDVDIGVSVEQPGKVEFYKDVADLYQNVRRIALGVDEALDHLIRELER